ncbi:MAG TPA: hypothetical protein PK031_05840 [Pseudomonadales bacterium]|nr:hypothetical protein [Pseudomonadales bacterium]
MQEHTAKKLRLSILLWLMFLTVVFPHLLQYYEQQQTFQWEKMVQPHWEVVASSPLVFEEALSVKDVPEWKSLDAPESIDTVPPDPVLPDKVEEKNPDPENASARKIKSKTKTASKKSNHLTLNLPENLYSHQTAEWGEKPPVVVPDLFAPKKDNPDRVQMGGRLIIDENKKKEQPDASYLDTVKGAEVNISIKVP